MKRRIRSMLALLLCLCFAAGCLAGCAGKKEQETESSSAEELTSEIVSEEEITEETTAAPVWKDNGEAEEMDRLLAKKNQVFTSEAVKITAEPGLSPEEESRYTVLVYMTGSDLESGGAYASKDMMEMRDSGLELDDVNLILYTGGCQSWKSFVPNSCNCVIDMAAEGTGIVGKTPKNADMGAPETLAAFLNFATEYYPAEHYALVFWDHGGGPLWGYGNDELFDGDALLLAEMGRAMKQTVFGKGKKLDLVGFDACLMGSFEVMTVWSDYAEYFVASEELEPGDGWNYHFLEVLNDSSDPEEIAGRILAEYEKHYDELRTEFYDPQVTLSCVKLSGTSKMVRVLENLFARMSKGVQHGDYSLLQQLRNETKSFGNVETRASGLYSYDLVDLGDLIAHLSDVYPAECREAKAAFEGLVTAQTTNVPGATGVTLYYPFKNKGQYEKLGSAYKEIVFSGAYSGYLKDMTREWLYSKSRDWNIGKLKLEGGEWVCQLTDEQQKNLAGAYYTVIEHDADRGIYTGLLRNCRVYPDRAGTLRIPADPELICLQSDSDKERVWPVMQVEKNNLRESYLTVNTRLFADSNPFSRMLSSDSMAVSALFTVDAKTGEMKVNSVTEAVATADLGGKNTVDLTGWETIYFYTHDNVPTNDVNGHLLPYDQWYENAGSTWYSMVGFDKEFTFTRMKASETAINYTIQLVLEDTNGERYASELTPDTQPQYRSVPVDTPKGKITYAVYKDHAEVLGYEGSDEEMTVPETVEGLPVTALASGAFQQASVGSGHTVPQLRTVKLPSGITEIGEHAFYNCRYLEELELPEGLEIIGECAFAGCSKLAQIKLPESLRRLGKGCFDGCKELKEVRLPAVMERIGEGAFMNCAALEKITGEAEGGYRLQDGVLYNEDGTVLLACPAQKGGKVAAAEGTERIGYGSLYGSEITELVLPEGIREIGGYACFQCMKLAAPDFPESLEAIGPYAFGAAAYTWDVTAIPKTQQEIRLGANVRVIGNGAFDLFAARTFAVSEENPYFASVNGHLSNLAKDTLQVLATSRDQICRIPDGVTSFDWDLMDYEMTYNLFDGGIEIHLEIPQSVRVIYGGPTVTPEHFVIHAEAGSLGQRFAARYGITWDASPAADYHVAEVPTEKGTIYARVFEDHAMILAYAGTDQTLVIPEEIEGVPVTVLGDGKNPVEPTSYSVYSDLDVDFTEVETAKVEHLVVPKTLEVFSDQAFAYNSMAGSGMELPEGLRVIGDHSLPDGFDAEEIVLPKSVEYIGADLPTKVHEIPVTEKTSFISPEAVSCRTWKTAFVQYGENERYKVIDGALYSADGKTLICWPYCDFNAEVVVPEGVETLGSHCLEYCYGASLQLPSTLKTVEERALNGSWEFTSLEFPEGVTTIGYGACWGMDKLTSVVFPSTIREIGDRAFSSCELLTTVTLPEGLTYLGERAFDQTAITKIELPESLTVIENDVFGTNHDEVREGEGYVLRIGPNLREIGDNAFASLPVTAYEVDEANPYFRSLGGLLYDKTGQVLWACPCGMSGEVHTDENTKVIRGYAFEACRNVTDVYVGAGVQMISSIAIPDDYWRPTPDGWGEYVNEYWITLHCPKGSYAESFAIIYDIPYVAE
ncbi:MAG: leucine-rich repeat protein [Lachnospiraceae bacterium]|nr:leucine-rich repeat protein [Lachnospiraceae bacterium]